MERVFHPKVKIQKRKSFDSFLRKLSVKENSSLDWIVEVGLHKKREGQSGLRSEQKNIVQTLIAVLWNCLFITKNFEKNY